MGCGGSKVDELQLVTLCRERKEFLKAASQQRYAFAASHVSYFRSLEHIGDALRKFVDEEIVIAGLGSSSAPGSPVLTLPSEEGKRKKPKTAGGKNKNHNSSTSSTSISHSVSISEEHFRDQGTAKDIEESHLHLSSGSEFDFEAGSPSEHIHAVDSPEEQDYPAPYAYPPGEYWGPPPGANNTYAYYMKKSATPAKRMVYEEPERYSASYGQWPDSSNNYPAYSGYPQYGNGGSYGFGMGSPSQNYQYNQHQPSPPAPPPAPPSPPRVSPWDYINVFENYNYDNPGFYARSGQGYGSDASSPDSNEVRMREGIPDLEDETEHEELKEAHRERKKLNGDHLTDKYGNLGEGTSKDVPSQSREESSKAVPPMQNSDSSMSGEGKGVTSSPETIVLETFEEGSVWKKGVSFEVEESSILDVESSKPSSFSASGPGTRDSTMPSSLTTLSAHGIRDLPEVVKEIRDEFDAASSYGKEVAMLLEVGKLPYQSKTTALKVIFARILYLVAPSMLSSPPSRSTVRLDVRTMKMGKEYSEFGDSRSEFSAGNLSSTLEKLYAWEKKLYKEVKDEERLRLIYEKECKRLKTLDDRGADSSKIDASQASVRNLLTKIDVCIRAVDAISSKIHKLRDEELEPQLTKLIHGLIRMWKSMLKCHQKQFQVIMESKTRSLKAKTGFRGDSSLKAALELEMELLNWSTRFNNWISTQKSYVESLNEWLLRFLDRKPEETPDGLAPFSPGRIGAPPIFIICNDWHQAMENISEKKVSNAIQDFASNLHELWERQDEEQRQRIRAEFVSKDFEKRLKTLHMERGRLEHAHEGNTSDRIAATKNPSESGISPLDDLTVDLDSMRKRLDEERGRHKDAIKLVHNAASNSIQTGLVPIFAALEKFSSEVLRAHEQVRVQGAGIS